MSSDKLTRLDIAREAGVSVSVVSRALNDSGYVAKEKKPVWLLFSWIKSGSNKPGYPVRSSGRGHVSIVKIHIPVCHAL